MPNSFSIFTKCSCNKNIEIIEIYKYEILINKIHNNIEFNASEIEVNLSRDNRYVVAVNHLKHGELLFKI